MIFHEETKWNGLFAGLALLLLLCLFFPFPVDPRELFSEEGFFAAAVRELHKFPPCMKVQGDLYIGGAPLYPMIVKGLVMSGVDPTTALRIVPAFSLLGIGAVVFGICFRVSGLTAGMVGLCALLLNPITADKFMEGNPVLTGTLILFGLWMLWFEFGACQGKWKTASVAVMFLGGLAFYTISWTGLILAVVPMFFLRRPLSLWNKQQGIFFLRSALILLLFFLLWGLPRWVFQEEPVVFRGSILALPSLRKYLLHLVTFPFDAAIRFFPWTLFLWAPFCPALETIDKNQLFSKYLRTLFLTTFLLLWISPFYSSRDMFYLLPVASVQCALFYWIVVRRYGWSLLKWFRIISGLVLLFCIALAVFLLFPEIRRFLPFPAADFEKLPHFYAAVLCTVLGGIAAAAAWFAARTGGRIWLVICLCSAGIILPFRGVIRQEQALDRSREQMGLTLKKAVGCPVETLTVYRMPPIPPFCGEMFYFGANIKTIDSSAELPQEEPVVYVFSSVVPSVPERKWERLYHGSYRKTDLELWRGSLKTEDDYE